MEMTKQRKMLISVLAIGLGGLALDRFVLGSPDSASADAGGIPVDATPPAPPISTPSSEATSNNSADADQPESLPSYASLTERLILAQSQQHTQSQDFSDPFSVPEDWTPRQVVQTTGQPDAVIEQSPSLEQYLFNQYRLDSTSSVQTNGEEVMLAVVAHGQSRGQFLRLNDLVEVRYPSPTPGGDDLVERLRLVDVGNRYVVWQSTTLEPQIRIRMDMHTGNTQ